MRPDEIGSHFRGLFDGTNDYVGPVTPIEFISCQTDLRQDGQRHEGGYDDKGQSGDRYGVSSRSLPERFWLLYVKRFWLLYVIGGFLGWWLGAIVLRRMGVIR